MSKLTFLSVTTWKEALKKENLKLRKMSMAKTKSKNVSMKKVILESASINASEKGVKKHSSKTRLKWINLQSDEKLPLFTFPAFRRISLVARLLRRLKYLRYIELSLAYVLLDLAIHLLKRAFVRRWNSLLRRIVRGIQLICHFQSWGFVSRILEVHFLFFVIVHRFVWVFLQVFIDHGVEHETLAYFGKVSLFLF